MEQKQYTLTIQLHDGTCRVRHFRTSQARDQAILAIQYRNLMQSLWTHTRTCIISNETTSQFIKPPAGTTLCSGSTVDQTPHCCKWSWWLSHAREPNTPQRTHVSDIEKRNPHDQHTGSANSLQIRSESGECTWQIHTTLTIHNSQVRRITSPQHTWHPSSGTCECNGSVCDTISCVTAQSSIQYNHNHQ